MKFAFQCLSHFLRIEPILVPPQDIAPPTHTKESITGSVFYEHCFVESYCGTGSARCASCFSMLTFYLSLILSLLFIISCHYPGFLTYHFSYDK